MFNTYNFDTQNFVA